MATVKVGYTVKHTFNKKYIKDQIRKMQDGVMLVGWDKNQHESNGMLTAEVAYLNEVGHYIHHKNGNTTHIVARPFLSYTVEQNEKHWFAAWRKMVRMYFEGQYKTFRQIMQILCRDYIIEDIRRTVVEKKPFAPNYRTNKKTGKREFLSKTPLIDEGTMIGNLTYEVRTKGK